MRRVRTSTCPRLCQVPLRAVQSHLIRYTLLKPSCLSSLNVQEVIGQGTGTPRIRCRPSSANLGRRRARADPAPIWRHPRRPPGICRPGVRPEYDPRSAASKDGVTPPGVRITPPGRDGVAPARDGVLFARESVSLQQPSRRSAGRMPNVGPAARPRPPRSSK